MRLLRHQPAQVAIRAERHRHALHKAGQDREDLAAFCRGEIAKRGHSQIRGDRNALRRAKTGHWRGSAFSPGSWRAAQRSTAAISLTALDGPAESGTESPLQHLV